MTTKPFTPRVIEHIIHNADPQNKTIARASTVPKKSYDPVAIHDGMTRQQQAMAGVGGMGHPVAGAPDAASANPLDPTVPGKNFPAVKLMPGMRSRTSPDLTDNAHRDLGALVLASATRTR